MNTSKESLKENLIYLSIWLLLLLMPIISMGLRMTNDSSLTFSWMEIIHQWWILVPFLIVFLIHNYIIAPLLIYKKKTWLYLGLTLSIIVLFQLYQCQQKPHFDRQHRPIVSSIHEPGPPHTQEGLHGEDAFPPPLPIAENGRHYPGDNPPPDDNMKKPRGLPPAFLVEHDILTIIVILLMIGANLGVKQYFKSSKDRKRLQELERKNLEQQLEYLKYQINPHFFMNTLNNIHALVDIEPEEAKHSIVELSKMMRYVLYEGAKSSVPLKKDIDFLKNYVTLMKLRYTDKVTIKFDTPDDISNKMVPPMLLITFVENAFKHGVSYKTPSFIDINISTINDKLIFVCRNSKTENTTNTQGGVGLANTRQRLDLIYGSDYRLDINDDDNTYEVVLEMGLQDSK